MFFEFALPGDRQEVMDLYDLVFPGEHDYCTYYHEHFWKPDRCLVIRDQGKIVSMVNLMDVELDAGEEKVSATYIYAAATHPDYRGRGLMGSMLEFSFGMGEAEGKDLSVLITENDTLFDFYARFGYLPSFSVAEFGCCEESPLPMCKARMIRESDIPAIDHLYSASSADRMVIARDGQRWKEIMEEYNDHVFGLFDQNETTLLAYCLMDGEGIHAVEAMGLGADYLLWCCSMKPEEATGRTMAHPKALKNIPVGCALPLSERGKSLLENGNLPPYINILFN